MSKLFIPYIMANKQLIHNIQLLSQNGADIIEIGVPFSDPVADGPTIMKAGQKAINEGINIHFIFEELIKHKDEIDSKYVLMTYYNIILKYGEEAFFKKCEEANVYGLIIPDLPFELAEQLKRKIKNFDVKIIPLLAMTTSNERMIEIAKNAEGFIYTVTMNATTGQNGGFHNELKEKLAYIKSIAKVPVVAGFGIRTTEHVKEISTIADGVVIGSEIVERLENNSQSEFTSYLQSIKNALNS